VKHEVLCQKHSPYTLLDPHVHTTASHQATPITGITNLYLTMYAFRISTDESAPLTIFMTKGLSKKQKSTEIFDL